ncbi:UNVERIFIED_CONTAM: hypothetical protein K2H54_006662 [Gekko kuhli]
MHAATTAESAASLTGELQPPAVGPAPTPESTEDEVQDEAETETPMASEDEEEYLPSPEWDLNEAFSEEQQADPSLEPTRRLLAVRGRRLTAAEPLAWMYSSH